MRHFILSVHTSEPAPVGIGDAASWLQYYKLNPAEEVSVPRLAGLEDALEGDLLWLATDAKLLGYVIILRSTRDEFNARDDLWFNSAKVTTATKTALVDDKTGPVSAERAASWFPCTRDP